MDIPNEIFVNQYPEYIAIQYHKSIEDAKKSSDGTEVKILKYTLTGYSEA